jgi:hypothetical protein
MPSKNLVRVYSDRTYVYTTTVRHQGTTVAFAMDDSRRIYYSVLNLDLGSRERGEIDSSYWNDDPPALAFPTEVTDVGFGGGETVGMPVVKLGGRAEEAADEHYWPEDLDPVLSTTARLGAQAPFQVVSDGRYLLLFRQSVDETHPDALFRLTGGGVSGDPARTDYTQAGGAKVPLVSRTVLCDRFVQVGAEVKPVLEVRYQRSRNKTTPASSGDTLGTKDLDGFPFYEPTRRLSFVRNVTAGEFTVLLLPTQVDGVSRWQLFAVNSVTGRLDAFNLERADDGLFNLAGTQFYTSPDPRFASSVLEREPGVDQFTKQPLVPVPLPTDRAGTALRFDGTSAYVDLGSSPNASVQDAYTVEAWINPSAVAGGVVVALGDGSQAGSFLLRLDANRMLVLRHGGTSTTVTSPAAVSTGRYTHVAAVFSGGTQPTATLYIDGAKVASSATLPTRPTSSGLVAYIGARPSGTAAADFFTGTIDEVRIWNQARPDADVARDRKRRLSGIEPGLLAYYRFDEGAGTSTADHTDNGFNGTVQGTATWVTSAAPVGDSPGLSRETFDFAGRSLASGVAAVLYFQQEDTLTGYTGAPSPAKRQARVLLACPTANASAPSDPPLLATLDLVLAADGRLAQAPRSITLPTLGRPNPTADMDALSAAQTAVTTAQARVLQDESLVNQTALTVQQKLPNYQYWNSRYWNFVNSGYCYDNGEWISPLDRSPRADYLLGQLNTASGQYNAAVRSQDDAQTRLAADRQTLADKQAALAALSGGMQGGDDVLLAMPTVAVDNTGLSVCGAVLAFAWSQDTPVLLDSATGDVVLYFRGSDGQFFSVYYDATASRLTRQITLPSGKLALTSRDTGVDLPELSVTVSNGPDADRCTVVVTRTSNQQTYTETFNAVPRRADRLAAVLNGTPTGDLLGTVASVQTNTVTLAKPLAAALTTGTQLTLAGSVYQLGSNAAAGASTLTLTAAPASAPAGAQVRTVVYDYASATSSRPGASLANGSLLVSADADAGTATDAVPNGTAADVAAGRGNRWRGRAPGRAFSFDGTKQRLALPAAQRPQATMAGDLTLEAWANPGFVATQSRVVHASMLTTPATPGVGLPAALDFNGSTDYLDCGTGIDLTGTDFTVEFWAKRLSTGRADIIVGLGTTTTTSQNLHIGFRNNNDCFTMDFWNDGLDAPSSYSDLTWHHWACVYKRADRTQIIYRDGVQVATRTATAHFAGTGKLVLGKVATDERKAYAQLDEVRVWGRVRSADELKADKDRRLTGRETGLLGYWNFPGRRTTDLTGRGNDATIFGNPTVAGSVFPGYMIPTTRYTLGVAGAGMPTALEFNGSSDYLDCGTGITLAGTSFTVELWLKRQTTGRYDNCVGHSTTVETNRCLHIGFRESNSFMFDFWGNGVDAPSSYSDLNWHHWACVYDREGTNKNQIIYRDGVEVARRPASADFAGTGALFIGKAGGGLASAQLDEVRVWNRARSVDELKADKDRRLTGRETGLLGYWNFPNRRTTDLTGKGNNATVVGNPRVVGSAFPGYTILAGVGNQFVRSRDVYPAGQWGHLAAVFHQDWALRLDGAAWLGAARADAFNITGELTIEVSLQLDALGGTAQGLVCKGGLADGAGGTVPYAFYIQADGALAFTYGNTAGTQPGIAVSTTKLTAGVFTRVAVTRKPNSTNPNGTDIQFYVNGASAGSVVTLTGPAPTGNDGVLEVGRHRSGQTGYGLRGVLSEVRLWNIARDAAKIGVAVTESTPGLVARWAFPEGAGNTSADATGTYTARLHGASWVKTPDPAGNQFRLYQNGNSTPADPVPATDALVTTGYGPEQFTVGGYTATDGTLRDAFGGTLDEIRVWRAARTEEQILDNVFTRLRGESEDLVCYYPFDASSTVSGAPVHDAGPRGNNLATTAGSEPAVVLSTAPVSTDTAEVRSALTGIRTAFNELIGSAPAVTEYADAQRVPPRGMRGVMKRCYAYQQGGRWYLVTGYKIGNLVSEWVGQAQFDPQLVGYIEGAPPVPSENLVKTSGADGYADASTVSFVQADEVVNTLSSSRESSVDFSASLKFKWEMNEDIRAIAAPLGVGISKPAAKIDFEANLDFALEFSNSWSSETEVSEGRNTTRTSSVGLSGTWEDPARILNPAAGQRWVPANTGFALVQSDTADVFALRLEHNRALVAYRMVPNPDIPQDWNIIEFQVNPLYTKQGTLDGLVGYGLSGPFADPAHYPSAGDGAEYSYYKPSEAYALKRRIERQEQALQAFYDLASTETHAPDQAVERANRILNEAGVPSPGSGTGGSAAAGKAANRASARRNLANTYVWTAGGGFFAESTATTDAVTQTTGGSYSLKGSVTGGGMFGSSVSAVGFKAGFEISLGGGTSLTRTKKKESKETFQLDIACTGGRDLQRYKSDGTLVYDTATNLPVKAPGRVDAYRFMTFYLDVAKDNFEDFYGKVVDPVWLANSPQAAALRQANQANQKPPCWRVFHRVTFVSRLLDPVAASSTAPASLAKALQGEGFASAYDLIKALEPDIKDSPANLANLANLAAATIDTLTKNFYRLTPYTQDIIVLVARYFGIDE